VRHRAVAWACRAREVCLRSLVRDKRVLADLALFLTAVIWGSAFSAQRVAAAHLGHFVYNGLRFLLAVAVLLPLTRGRSSFTRLEWRGGLLAGLLLAAAAALQQAGLAFTTAGKAGFITSLYVVLVPLLLALVWRQWPHWMAWVASGVATVGLFLLSMQGTWTLALGDGLELAGAVLWALHVIVIGRLSVRTDALRLSLVQYLVCGVLNLALGLTLERGTLDGLPAAWWAIVYGGVFSVGLGYTLQVYGQRVAPATDAALVLSLESVFAALGGWLLLGEALTHVQILGCALMMAGVLLAQVSALRRSRAG
jgi:drug/metabolite transporter (DMT)-like permease